MKFNNLIRNIGLASIALISLNACKKYDGDSYDFSDKAQKYIKVTSGQLLEINAETVDTLVIDGTDTIECYYHIPDEEPISVAIETREGLPAVVSYTVEYKSATRTEILNGTHPKFTINSGVPFTVEDSEFTDDEIEGTLTLKSVTGFDLRMGYPFAGDGLVAKFVAYKPYVIHEY